MEHMARSRPGRAALLLAALALLTLTAATAAAELQTSGSAPEVRIHSPEQTLRDYCRRDLDGRLWLEIPGWVSCELVLTTSDPAIANPGDGAFHPFDEAEVRGALAEVRYPLGAIRADVFILPYPCRSGLESAAGSQLILLSPGVRPLPREQQHAEFVHELGHVVQRTLLPDADEARWQEYRRIRGIEDTRIYSPTSQHADRPHEIFAEDFRVLFGGALANYSGSIENPRLTEPLLVPGLREFMLGLAGDLRAVELHVTPNPSRGPLSFCRAGHTAAPLDLFDAQGRRIATLEPVPAAGSVQWIWSGADLKSSHLKVGVLFARVRDGSGAATRVTILP